MDGEDDAATAFGEAGESFEQLKGGEGIESSSGFIQHEHGRKRDEDAADRESVARISFPPLRASERRHTDASPLLRFPS